MSENTKTQLTNRQLLAIPHLIGSPTLEEGRKRAKVSKATLYKWLKDPRFKEELRRRRNEVARDALDRLKGLVGKAIDKLAELIDSEKPYIQKAVAEKIIDYTLRSIEIEELEERLERIEEIVLNRQR